MTVKLFVLGLPGSGKSSVARYISTYARDRQWSITRFNDYLILQKMFHEDIEGKQFKPADHGGFDVLNLTVFDIALKSLEQQVNEHISDANSEEIILIEFARNDYYRAFHQFSDKFLRDAYFLYLDAEIDICKQRIRDRVAWPTYDDDHYVSDYIFEAYYHGDNGQCLSNILERDYMIDSQRVLVINNNYLLEEASKKIEPFIDSIICPDLKTASAPSNGFEEVALDDTASIPVYEAESFKPSNTEGTSANNLEESISSDTIDATETLVGMS